MYHFIVSDLKCLLAIMRYTRLPVNGALYVRRFTLNLISNLRDHYKLINGTHSKVLVNPWRLHELEPWTLRERRIIPISIYHNLANAKSKDFYLQVSRYRLLILQSNTACGYFFLNPRRNFTAVQTISKCHFSSSADQKSYTHTLCPLPWAWSSAGTIDAIKTECWATVGSMLCQCLRHWHNIVPTVAARLRGALYGQRQKSESTRDLMTFLSTCYMN